MSAKTEAENPLIDTTPSDTINQVRAVLAAVGDASAALLECPDENASFGIHLMLRTVDNALHYEQDRIINRREGDPEPAKKQPPTAADKREGLKTLKRFRGHINELEKEARKELRDLVAAERKGKRGNGATRMERRRSEA